MNKRMIGALVPLAAVTLALSGCGGDPLGATEPSGAGEPGGGSAELTPISVVVAPIHFEPTYIADREGFFEEEGLDVEIIRGADPTSNIARVVSGEVQITTGSLGTLVTSNARGVPVTAIAGNGYTSAEYATSGILALESSGIESPADLAGRTVGIQGLNTGSEIGMFLAAEDHGIDPMSIERVELASAGMETALLEGTVDAVLASSPFFEQIGARDGVSLVSTPSTEYLAGSPITVWTVTREWVGANADTAKAFIRAMEKAQAFYEDDANAEAVLDITAEISEVDRESLSADSLIPISVAIDEEQAKVQADAFVEYGIIDTAVTIDDLLWSEAPRR
ncbi:ABC transporter substrate-binding protein [Microbacterium album]|uniref:Sulfonate ABC transporter substrate-binding protein n=1 Tax=Microbacterium album TaxID=2053191 RepID=A0A917MM52_9MICO|nr:ABC transporter substrate-binding protein [Microbacterium album]GGH42359.1 sulfonate ABC transporter substrate-binding protein [Microbacterium album]